MAEAVVLVCDICGRPAAQTVTFKVGRRNLQKDYCEIHIAELTAGARAPRPGRRRGIVAVPPAKRRGRPPKSGSAPVRRGRSRKAAVKART